MANRLANAGYLELTDGWVVSAPLTLSIDEATRGAPGRAVLKASGASNAVNQTLTVQPDTGDRPAAVAGEVIELAVWCAAFVAGAAVAPVVRLVFRNAGGAEISAVTPTVQSPSLSLHGEAIAGLTATFRRAWVRATAPANTATATLEVRATAAASGQSVEILVLKPLLDAPPTGRTDPLLWDPGVHADPDLQLPAWPAVLKPFLARGGADPRPDRAEFDAGAGRPSSRRTAADAVRRFEGVTRCDPVQRAALEAFHASDPGDFWFVEPDSERLCVASFTADGQPRPGEPRGPTVLMSLALWLETA